MSTAQCKFECQNGGRCVGLNKCKCRPGFTGTQCQIRQYTLAVGYSSLALSVRSVSIRLLLFTGTQCQIRQYTLAVGYSSLALSVRSVSTPLLLVTLHRHSVSDPSVHPCCCSYATLLTVGLQSHHMHPSSTLCFRSHLRSWCFFHIVNCSIFVRYCVTFD